MFDMLCKLGLQETFGLRYLDEYDPELSLEITEGNANIMMPRGSVTDSSVIEALWFLVLEITIAATAGKSASSLARDTRETIVAGSPLNLFHHREFNIFNAFRFYNFFIIKRQALVGDQ